ncbi:Wzz/FepE/Etk N-terminal domain-containing protein [Planococcus shenhongbingii]|uniref:YveK family protein n=1 Tax=Planococcus shenhongbingii TaxID=3058398 RepID=UPI00260AF9F5|nr:Wzz/FepE/Etk N-terminal domain-containing protein [Planococcus sp. N016]WKA57670.1 Wzz/FepE/Etk N-terminal domain-containing protein [Planococcus sp. N016]
MESTFNIKEFLQALRKRLPLIIIVTLLFVALSGIVSYTMMKPIYEASTQILVNQRVTNPLQASEQLNIDANLQLVETYNIIIKSPAILTEVIEELELKESVSDLNENISVSSAENSQILTVEVEDVSMERAVLIANTTASVFQAKIKSLMNVDNVNILAPAIVPVDPDPVKPDPMFNMAIGAIIGFMLGTGLAILLDQMNTTIRKEEDIEEIVGLQVLGIVSTVPEVKEFKRSANINDKKELIADVDTEKIKAVSNPKIGGSY